MVDARCPRACRRLGVLSVNAAQDDAAAAVPTLEGSMPLYPPAGKVRQASGRAYLCSPLPLPADSFAAKLDVFPE